MINYESFWSTLRQKNVSKYQLIYHWGVSSNTLRRMGHIETISITMLNELCLILDCCVQDIIDFIASDEETADIGRRREEIDIRKKRRKKSSDLFTPKSSELQSWKRHLRFSFGRMCYLTFFIFSVKTVSDMFAL